MPRSGGTSRLPPPASPRPPPPASPRPPHPVSSHPPPPATFHPPPSHTPYFPPYAHPYAAHHPTFPYPYMPSALTPPRPPPLPYFTGPHAPHWHYHAMWFAAEQQALRPPPPVVPCSHWALSPPAEAYGALDEVDEPDTPPPTANAHGGYAPPPPRVAEAEVRPAPSSLGLELSLLCCPVEELFDALLLRALERPRELSRPACGVSLHPVDLCFDVCRRAERQVRTLRVRNEGKEAALIRDIRLVPAESAFSVGEAVSARGALILPGEGVEVEVHADACEVGLCQSWLMLLLERVQCEGLCASRHSWVMGTHLALFVTNAATEHTLSVEAPAFFPAHLRHVWERGDTVSAGYAPPPFPKFDRQFTLDDYVPLDEEFRTQCERKVEILSRALDELLPRATADAAERGAPPRAGTAERDLSAIARLARHHLRCNDDSTAHVLWTVLHLERLGLLLLLEELQMLQDYKGLDAFNTTVWRQGEGESRVPVLAAVVPGIEERHPPVQEGDVVLLRMAELPAVEVPLTVTAVLRRKELRLLPAWGKCVQEGGVGVNSLCDGLSGMGQQQTAAALRKLFSARGGKALCHLRFQMNRVVWQFMHHSLRVELKLATHLKPTVQLLPSPAHLELLEEIRPITSVGGGRASARGASPQCFGTPRCASGTSPIKDAAAWGLEVDVESRSIRRAVAAIARRVATSAKKRRERLVLLLRATVLQEWRCFVTVEGTVLPHGGRSSFTVRVSQSVPPGEEGRGCICIGWTVCGEEAPEELPLTLGATAADLLSEVRSFGLCDVPDGEITASCDRSGGGLRLAFGRDGVLLGRPIEISAEEALPLQDLALQGVVCWRMSKWAAADAYCHEEDTSRPPSPPDELRLVGGLEPAACDGIMGWLRSLRSSELRQIQSGVVLNDEQRRAVADVVSGRHETIPYIIFGPPGTGKTMVVIESVLQLLLLHPDPHILLAAPSNAAADVLAKRLQDSLASLGDRLADASSRWPDGLAPDGRQVQPTTGRSARDILLRLNAQTRPVGEVLPEILGISCLDAATSKTAVPPLSRLKLYRVIVTTCGATHLLFEAGVESTGNQFDQVGENLSWDEVDFHFSHCIVDEASQALEPEVLLPLSFASPSTSIVLCGDHKQLGPVVRSSFCRAQGLGVSLLERLSHLPLYRAEGSSLITKLVRNYRSHESLLALPSKLFYNGALVPSSDEQYTHGLCHWEGLVTRGFPMLFIGCRSVHMHEVDSPSYFNPTEAEKVVEVVKKLLAQTIQIGERQTNVSTSNIAILTPYRKQVIKIREALRMCGGGLGNVRVGSVDDYQGQEEDIVLISTVLALGSPGAVPALAHGLMSSPQRFNVAISRAKMLLVVIGDPNVLFEDTSWRQLLKYAVDNNAYRGCPHPYLMEGAPDEDDGIAEATRRMLELARRSFGAGALSQIFPSLSGDQSDAYLDCDDQPWRVML